MADMIDTISRGRASYASTQREWHGLGELMTVGATVEDWQKQSGMDYKVQRAFVRYAPSREATTIDTMGVMKDKVVLFRSDTNAPLGLVSDSYHVVQPAEVLEFFREWAEQGGMTIESAGVLFGGKKYFATAKLAEGVCVDGTNDKIVPYALLSTSADGTTRTEGRWTAVRVVCNNTLRMATSGSSSCYALSHRSKFKADVAKKTIESANKEFGAFMDSARLLAKLRISTKDAEGLTVRLLMTGVSAEKSADDIRGTAGFNSIMRLFNGAAMGAQLETAHGTAWGWLNAITEQVDHHARTRNEENRIASALWGKGDDMKTKAMQMVLGG